jgi:hypothetical protein
MEYEQEVWHLPRTESKRSLLWEDCTIHHRFASFP